MAAGSREMLDLEGALRNQYVLERELGRGGMGVVFLARDLKLDRLVAIKALPLHLADDERVRERFLREARTAARLSHPNIVPVHRADEIDGRVFFVMGFVDGDSLAQRVAQRGPLPPDEVVGVLHDVADALHEAHRHGIIHRDVKAENILIEHRTGRAMVTDFGIARVIEAAPLTATGLLLGTAQYMSPEQIVGESVDARSDVYSLGVVAFHALTARFPFQSETASAVLVAHVTKPPPRLRDVAPSVPQALADIVDRCLAKEPGDRFQSAADLRTALNEAGAAPLPVRSQPARAATALLLSDREARDVWDRAANLQAQATGTATPIAPPKREAERQPLSPSSSYRLDVVRDAAREAGISTEYVDRALAERGFAGRAAAPSPAVRRAPPALPMEIRDLNVKPASPWAGAPSSIEYEVTVDGEISENDFAVLAETIRRTLSDVGVAGTMGRSFTWSTSDPKRRVHVAVQARGGRTTIRVAESLRQLMGSVFGGGVGGFGGGFGGAALGVIMGATQGAAEVAIPAALAIAATAYVGSRSVFKRTVRARQAELRELAARLAGEAKTSIESRTESRGR
ncbi:MAG TPA: serine/threonine-protein kinase [Gemmatimonadaceae bacterium]|nr:serine/threonine-protein kinase [Gemmatimonadaceae bacterium]